MNSACILLLIMLVIFIDKGQSIKCYQCSSIHDTWCGDDFRLMKDSTVDCTGSCVKYREHAHSRSCGGAGGISRGCQPHQEPKEECRVSIRNHHEAHSCFCNTDFCNTGVLCSLSVPMTVLSLFFTAFMWCKM